jgi:hypothetical protein
VNVEQGNDRRQGGHPPDFAPGFRINRLDATVLFVGGVATVALTQIDIWGAAVVAFVLCHFFLFCKVFRLARFPELLWAACFLGLATMTIGTGQPSWPVTLGLSAVITLCLITAEMRKPSYHGVAWRQINPNLPRWWTLHHPDADSSA